MKDPGFNLQILQHKLDRILSGSLESEERAQTALNKLKTELIACYPTLDHSPKKHAWDPPSRQNTWEGWVVNAVRVCSPKTHAVLFYELMPVLEEGGFVEKRAASNGEGFGYISTTCSNRNAGVFSAGAVILGGQKFKAETWIGVRQVSDGWRNVYFDSESVHKNARTCDAPGPKPPAPKVRQEGIQLPRRQRAHME